MERIAPGYQAPDEMEFETVADGRYTAESFEFFTLDETTKKPILVSQRDGRMVARARIYTAEGVEPPISLDLSDVRLLVLAFGADLSQLPSIPHLQDVEGVSNYLGFAEILCRQGKKTPKFQVKGGWADIVRIEGAYPPKGTYSWQVQGFEPTKEGKPFLLESYKYPGSYYFYIRLVCIGDGLGQPNQYTGVSVRTILSYKVEVADGKPRWTTIKKGPQAGQYTKTAIDFARFIEVIAPSWFENPVMVADSNCILPELLETCLQDGVVFSAFASTSDSGYWGINHETAVELKREATNPQISAAPIVSSANKIDSLESVKMVVEVLALMEGLSNVWQDEATLNPVSEVFPVLKKYFTPARESGILNAARLDALSAKECYNLIMTSLPLESFDAGTSEKLLNIATLLRGELNDTATEPETEELF